MSRWIELSFIEDVKILQKYGLNEYYNKANMGLYEFVNPQLSYSYEEINMSDGQKMWKIEKQNGDPILVVTLKKLGLDIRYWVLDFYFPEAEKGFSRNKGVVKGKHYLDTISKIVRDEVIPYFKSSNLDVLFFKAYSNDGGGQMRKNLFQRLIDKYLPEKGFDVKLEGSNFIITKGGYETKELPKIQFPNLKK